MTTFTKILSSLQWAFLLTLTITKDMDSTYPYSINQKEESTFSITRQSKEKSSHPPTTKRNPLNIRTRPLGERDEEDFSMAREG